MELLNTDDYIIEGITSHARLLLLPHIDTRSLFPFKQSYIRQSNPKTLPLLRFSTSRIQHRHTTPRH
jgi:hypothetical protein